MGQLKCSTRFFFQCHMAIIFKFLTKLAFYFVTIAMQSLLQIRSMEIRDTVFRFLMM